MRSKLLTCALAFILLFGGASVAGADNANLVVGDNNTVVFIDVGKEWQWARDSIYYFAEQGIVNGVGDSRFAPGQKVTREEFAKMLVLTFSAPLEAPDEPTFADVPREKWSYPYIETAKEFLTGYANPFGGKMTFQPTTAATREDIAVALVRMMGLTDKDARDPNYARRTFGDAGAISPGLVTYISIAAERGLIAGYPDGTFRPNQNITRAETVVLLHRAMKQAVTSYNAELDVTANIVVGNNPAKITLMITAEEGTRVTVDGQSVRMDPMGNGYVGGSVLHTFAEEGSKTFIIEAVKGGKRARIEKKHEYRIGAPELTITEAPETTDKSSVTIRGMVKDANDRYPVVTVNGETAHVDSYNGRFEKMIYLKEGANTVTIVATNKEGKSTTVTRTITFSVGAPELTITEAPEATDKSSVTIRGMVKDTNDRYPVVTVNGEEAFVDSHNGRFEKTIYLKEGANTVTIVATNKLGKSATVTKTITFSVGAPVLTITEAPETTDKSNVVIRGMVTDQNDRYPVVTINGQSVFVDSYNGRFEKTVSLTEGVNTFKIVASNKLGKSTTIEKQIVFTPAAPEIVFTNVPEVTNQQTISLQGYVKDATGDVKLYVNDQEVRLNGGSFSKTVTLSEGDNLFVFRAVNRHGKSTSIARTVRYGEIAAPILTVDPVPAETTAAALTVTGTVSDNLDPAVSVYVNDRKVASSAGGWSAVMDLKEGLNDIIVVATNKYGKSATIVKQVTYKPEAGADE